MNSTYTGIVDESCLVTILGSPTTYSYPSQKIKTQILGGMKTSVDAGVFIPGVYRVNPYYVRQETMDGGDCVAKSISVDGIWTYSVEDRGALFVTPLLAQKNMFPAFNTATIKDIAIQKAYSKIAAADLALGEAIGELKETIEMLHHPLLSLRKFLNKDNQYMRKRLLQLFAWSRTGHWQGARTVLEATKLASDTWMEVRYGLRPLMYLVQDVVEQVVKVDTREFSPSRIRSARSGARGPDVVKTSDDVAYSAGTYYLSLMCNLEWKIETHAYASVQYLQSRSLVLSEKVGLSAPYLPEVAWELTRLSFVADWFVTIGPWLGSYRVKPMIKVLGNTVGVKVKKTLTCKDGRCRSTFNVKPPWSSFAGVGTYVDESYNREINHALPLLPQFTGGVVIDLFRVIDMIAIIAQRLL